MAALLFAVLLAGCSVQKETEASGDQQQETWSEEMENSTALSEEPDDTDTIGNADNPEDTGDIGNPENPEDTSTCRFRFWMKSIQRFRLGHRVRL